MIKFLRCNYRQTGKDAHRPVVRNHGERNAKLPHLAGALSYPARPITMVVPFAAGAPSDVIGRIFAETDAGVTRSTHHY
jgi:hypothetical protein